MMRILQAADISRHIKGKVIYENISINIYAGDCYGIIGADYAGKTSILHTLMGLMHSDGGTVRWFEEEKSCKSVKRDIGYVPDDLLCFENMTGAELLDMTIKLGKRKTGIDEAETLIDYFGVNPCLRLDEMDEDMNKCTYIISAFLKEPRVLVLDEPFNFLGDISSKKLKNIIMKYVKSGNTVIIASDNCEEIMDICTKFSAIKDGRQIRRDEDLSWYTPAKAIAVYDIDTESERLLDNKKGIVKAKSGANESIYLYMGNPDGLRELLYGLKCRDFNVSDLTVEAQIFKEYYWAEEAFE